eukprot:CAMPEP_0185746042 /NCGR_PEP_ID=MMETSP1174-20130828/4450_1 /TAXON_ID=35687 /ORGANISM="Dictyocha speculum, Strain CCMP1381" /LENGTH=123 /DNA_ID=CAMNT_0028420411 /DNA_START=143 /DNA_END=511 /DNA_ORIENTATION=-
MTVTDPTTPQQRPAQGVVSIGHRHERVWRLVADGPLGQAQYRIATFTVASDVAASVAGARAPLRVGAVFRPPARQMPFRAALAVDAVVGCLWLPGRWTPIWAALAVDAVVGDAPASAAAAAAT